MPVSGLVLSLCEPPSRYAETLTRIQHEPAITLGELVGRRLALVVTTDSRDHDRRLWDWLHSLPGVMAVDVVFVGFDDTENAENTENAETCDAETTRMRPRQVPADLGGAESSGPSGTTRPHGRLAAAGHISDRKDASHDGC